jgi:3-hydroxymyristoyl/3-hydroxydecanoyl-(acyl carrier protein) dehydratase
MMESREIQSFLPHRYPFLLVDRILEIEPGKKGIGIKNLTGGEWFFQGHTAYPPILLLESLAQVGGIVLASKVRERNPEGQFIGLFAGVPSFQFQRPAVLGEVITLKVEATQSLGTLYRFAAEVFVGGEKIAGGQILISFTETPTGDSKRKAAGKK